MKKTKRTEKIRYGKGMSLFVKKTSVFPAGRREVFCQIRKLATLQEIAWPYATFTSTDGNEDMNWEPGKTASFRFRLFGIIPFGTHTIHVVRFSETEGIYTHEWNEHVPIWNHEIILRELTDKTCEYTDRVEIDAGWKTVFVYLWARCFYTHRQKKWIRILNRVSRRR